MLRSPSSLLISPRSEIDEMNETVFSLDGSYLSLTGANITSLPSFVNKKHQGREILEFVTSLDASVNNLE